MADLRVKIPFKLVDPTTDANAAGVSAAGDLQVELGVAIPTGANVIGNVGLEAGTNNVGDVDVVGGTLASDAPLTTNPVTIGGRASTATPAAVTADGDVVDLWLSREGAMAVDVKSGGGGQTDTDDDVVAGAQVANLGIGLNYAWDGSQWERLTSDASGSLDANITLALPTGANVIGNVGLEAGANNVGDVDIVGGTLASDAPLTTNPVTIGGRGSTATPTPVSADGDVVDLWLSLTGAAQVDILSGGGGPEDVDDDIVAGGQTAALAIALGYGYDGTQWERLTTDASGSLDTNITLALPTGANVIGNVGLEAGTNNVGDVDIVGGTLASDAPLTTNPVTMGGRASTATPAAVSADGDVVDLWLSLNGALAVDVKSGGSEPTPAGPTLEALIAATVTAGGTGFMDTAEITEAEKVWQVSVAATVPFKFRVGMQENTVRVTGVNKRTGWMFGQAGTVVNWQPAHRDFLVHAGSSGGTDTIYVEFFNMDNTETADIHSTIEYAT